MARIFMIILDSVCRFWPGKYQKAARKHPDAATMQRYFSKVRQISGQDWMHRLIMVLCSASGSMTLEDGAKRAGKLDPAARLSSELMEGHTRNTSSFARKRIAVFRHSGNENRPGACQAGCIFAGDKILGQPCAGPFLLSVSYIGIIVHHGSEGRA